MAPLIPCLRYGWTMAFQREESLSCCWVLYGGGVGGTWHLSSAFLDDQASIPVIPHVDWMRPMVFAWPDVRSVMYLRKTVRYHWVILLQGGSGVLG